MKTILLLPALLLSCISTAQSLIGLKGSGKSPERSAKNYRQEPELVAPVRRNLEPVTIHKSRYPSFTDAVPREPAPVTALLVPKPAPEPDRPVNEIPIRGETVYLVGGGYFMQERQQRVAEQAALSRTWPIGNELVGIVIKSGYPDKYPRP